MFSFNLIYDGHFTFFHCLNVTPWRRRLPLQRFHNDACLHCLKYDRWMKLSLKKWFCLFVQMYVNHIIVLKAANIESLAYLKKQLIEESLQTNL